MLQPEGVERFFSETLFMTLVQLQPDTDNGSRSTFYSFPPEVVPGSQRVHVAVVGVWHP